MNLKYIIAVLILINTLSSGNLLSQDLTDSVSYSEFVTKDLDKKYSSFKNTDVKIRLPLHYKEFSNEKISGYIHAGTASSIVANEMNETPYALVTDSLNKERIEGSGAKLKEQENSETYNGNPAKFYFMEFTVEDVEVIRVMFFTGDYNKTVLLQANYPKAFDKLLRSVIKESFRTVKFE